MKPDYKGFHEHVETWKEIGAPYGTKELLEIGILYGTIQPCDEDCYLFRRNTCELAGTGYYCRRMFKPENEFDDAGEQIW